MKLDPADILFSKYIRTRDKWICQRCKTKYPENSKGLHCSHFFGRQNEGTRFDPENCIALCFGCHQRWDERNREEYREYKIRQLGEKGFKLLRARADLPTKKDRKLSFLIVKKLYEQII